MPDLIRPRQFVLLALVVASSLFPSLSEIHQAAANWSTQPIQVTTGGIPHVTPSVAQDINGKVYIFWDQNPGINYIITNTSNIARNFWPAAQTYSLPGQNDYNPSLMALKNGTIMLFFARKSTLNWKILYSKYNSGQWSPETILTIEPSGPESPSPAIQDKNGNVLIAWTRNENADVKISFVDSNGNGIWDLGEPVIYDANKNGFYDTNEPVQFGTPPSPGTPVISDPRLKFIDSNGDSAWQAGEFIVYDSNQDSLYDPKFAFIDSNDNNVWDPGEKVVYDSDSNGLYAIHSGVGTCQGTALALDCMVFGSVPSANNTRVKADSRIRFIEYDGDGAWQPGEAVIYDANGNAKYDLGELPVGSISTDSKLKFQGAGPTWTQGNSVIYDSNLNGVYDSKIKFVNATNNPGETWASGKAVVYDNNLNGFYDPFDTKLLGTPSSGQALRNDPHLRFADSSANGSWDTGEPVLYDSNLNGLFDSMDQVIYGSAPALSTPLIVSIGESWINQGVPGVPAPTPGGSLQLDSKVKFVDLNSNGHWDPGEPVVYDSNNNGTIDPADPEIGGISSGTRLTTDEIVLGGILVSDNAPLSTDAGIRYVDSNGSNLWDQGETVIYDSDSNSIYTNGRFHNDTIITGSAPMNNTAVKSDPKLKYVESQASSTNWQTGEAVAYDSNSDGRHQSSEPVVAVFPIPSTGAILKVDPKIKYYETDGNNAWEAGESVVYDKNGNGVYDANETTISGAIPTEGAPLDTDSHIKFLDANADNLWERGETVVYDSSHNDLYDSGESVIGGSVPSVADPPDVVAHIFYKTSNGSSWGADQRLTDSPFGDQSPFLSQTKDGRVWIIWSGDRTFQSEILYKTTNDGITWSSETLLYPASTVDSNPSLAQDRNGTIWATWGHNVPCGNCGLFPYQVDLYTASSADNGATWSSPVDLTLNCSTSEGGCASTEEVEPRAIQLNDRKLYVFFSIWSGSGCSSCQENLFYLSNPIFPIHEAGIGSALMSSASLRIGQNLTISANVTNTGDYNDTVTVTLLANSTTVATNSSLIRAGKTVAFSFKWTVTAPSGKYVMTMKVADLGESPASQVDNTTPPGILQARPRGDVSGDCAVDIVDIVLVAVVFQKSVGDPGFNYSVDVNADGTINISDLVIVASGVGQTCPP